MATLFKRGRFVANSELILDFKIECDALSDEDIETLAYMISEKYYFSDVFGVPRGGDRLADALKKYINSKHGKILLVDDVLTTGGSMERRREELLKEDEYDEDYIFGIVVFARKRCPDWITPVFQLW